MKSWILALAAAAVCVAAWAPSTAQAQIKEKVLGVDAGLGLFLSDMGDASGSLVGGLVRYEQKLQPALSITGRLGYLRGLDKELMNVNGVKQTLATDIVTVRGGVVYRLQPEDNGVFLTGEVAFNYFSSRLNGEALDQTESELGGGVGVGYRTGVFTLRGAVEYLDFSHTSESLSALLTVGWDFKGL